jgi:hypothetical protein
MPRHPDPADYENMDRLIVAAVKNGITRPVLLEANEVVRAEAMRLARAHNNEVFRILDRRLQALRKAGKLQWTRGEGWSAV